MRYLLDTTALIDFSKGREPACSHILAMIEAGDELGVCAVNVAEFYAGLPPDKQPTLAGFIDSLNYLDITREAAMRAGQYRYEQARQGRSVSTSDAMVAAVAHHYHAVIVTDNVKDYPMPDIQLLPLRR